MEKAVDSLLAGGEEIEVLIVDDGSADETGAIADRLAAEHPSIIRAHHQPNGGHGSAINYGIAHAEGLYFKVVDSDDRLVRENVPGLMDVLRRHTDAGDRADLIFHDYVYDKPEKENSFMITYSGKLKPDTVATWDQCRTFHMWNQFMIHSLIYRTQFLRDIRLQLPEHTYYEDNLYIYQPLVYTERIMYHHAPLYGYFVGRDDQSINEANLLKRLDQMTEITKKQATSYTWEELNRVSPKLRKYMINNVCGQLFTNCALHFIEDSERSRRMNRELWQAIEAFDPALYRRLRRNPLGRVSCLPGRAGERFLVFVYRFGRKMIRF
jgi:glycosyltransferase involved in cell wall biosynthesis